MMDDLFAADGGLPKQKEALADGACLLRGHACDQANDFLEAIRRIALQSPFRQMKTPGGYRMSVAMTNCGPLGWISDGQGYSYSAIDPLTERPWPAMPDSFYDFSRQMAAEAGFPAFSPDVCLINRYALGAKLSLHQDKDEMNLLAPIVSLSFGLPAVFVFGGLKRNDPSQRLLLTHGDVVVWGGPSRLRHHAVLPIKEGNHPATGNCRINLTFRQAKR